MASLSPACTELKQKYDACFNTWYSTKFLQGSFTDDCQEVFIAYKECVMKSIKEKKLDKLIQEARASDGPSSTKESSGESTANGSSTKR